MVRVDIGTCRPASSSTCKADGPDNQDKCVFESYQGCILYFQLISGLLDSSRLFVMAVFCLTLV